MLEQAADLVSESRARLEIVFDFNQMLELQRYIWFLIERRRAMPGDGNDVGWAGSKVVIIQRAKHFLKLFRAGGIRNKHAANAIGPDSVQITGGLPSASWPIPHRLNRDQRVHQMS